jgi:DNA-binding beta-propeller fold protein YncE
MIYASDTTSGGGEDDAPPPTCDMNNLGVCLSVSESVNAYFKIVTRDNSDTEYAVPAYVQATVYEDTQSAASAASLRLFGAFPDNLVIECYEPDSADMKISYVTESSPADTCHCANEANDESYKFDKNNTTCVSALEIECGSNNIKYPFGQWKANGSSSFVHFWRQPNTGFDCSQQEAGNTNVVLAELTVTSTDHVVAPGGKTTLTITAYENFANNLQLILPGWLAAKVTESTTTTAGRENLEMASETELSFTLGAGVALTETQKEYITNNSTTTPVENAVFVTASNALAVRPNLSIPTTSLYVVNNLGNNIIRCAVNTETGALDSCEDASTDIDLTRPTGITLTNDGSYAYLISVDGISINEKIDLCEVQNGVLTNCSLATIAQAGMSGGLALTSDESTAYYTIVNSLDYCDVDNEHSLTNCGRFNNPAFQSPTFIALNSNDTIAWVTSKNNNDVYYCNLEDDGSVAACADTGGGLFNLPIGIAVNDIENIAYIVNNGDNLVIACDIEADNTFINCKNTQASDLSSPIGIALNESFAYISNNGDNTVSICEIQGDNAANTIFTCSNSDPDFTEPYGISF